MKKKLVKLLIATMLVAVMATSVVFLAACSPSVATKHSGNTVSGSFTAFETSFEYITLAAYTTLSNTWNDIDKEDDKDKTAFIFVNSSAELAGSNWINLVNDKKALQRRTLLNIDMFGDTLWTSLPRSAERTVGQGYFTLQDRSVNSGLNTADNNLGLDTPANIANIASRLGLAVSSEPVWTRALLQTHINLKWNASTPYNPNDLVGVAHDALVESNQAALRLAVTDVLVSQELRALGYFFSGNPTSLTFGSTTFDSEAVVTNNNWINLTRYIRQTVTKIETHLATANVASPTQSDRTVPMMWNETGKNLLTSGSVTIIDGEDDHAMRAIVTIRSASEMVKIGDNTNITATAEYFNGQIWKLGSIEFIVTKPANH
jgi:hypothetical protein